ncbi:hypothetical protein [Lactiplantibacillus daowaiensis]|uniref:Integral membrane protein n=1 Tax=Lactiplantibacillus daowaiensis TaxID=2559918 RepID=A0ABW1S154_9LACO|nr:hypothetical protein [Lactiplantibacillus daowaiensis]
MTQLPKKIQISVAIDLGLGLLSAIGLIVSWLGLTPTWLTGVRGIAAKLLVFVAIGTNQMMLKQSTVAPGLKRRLHLINTIILTLAVFARF